MLDRYSDAIEKVAIKLLTESTSDYAASIWSSIEEDVIACALKNSMAAKDGYFTTDDVALVLGLVLRNRLDIMTPNQYQELAMRTCSIRDTATGHENQDGIAVPMLTNAMLGLCGETGECADLVKKHLYQGHGLDKAHIAKELGDVAWYLAEAAEAIGYSLEDIFRMNIDKLKARYPEGHFDPKYSQHRKEGDI